MRFSRILLVVLVVFFTGCGGDKTIQPPPPPPGFEWRWPADPRELMIHVMQAFESRDTAHYGGLLTNDFRYRFSTATDPDLASAYPDWGRDDETSSAKHLFEGFVDSYGNVQPGASRIDLTFTGVQYGPDPVHPDSIEHYTRVVLTTVDGAFTIPGEPDTIVYAIHARHELCLVRGDAAVLTGDEEPIASRWYVRRWDDLSQPTSGVQQSAGPPSWGRLRAFYR